MKLRQQEVICKPLLVAYVTAELPEALPGYPSLPGASITVKLRQQEASAPFFRDLHAVLAATAASFQEAGLRPLAEALLAPTALEMGVTLDADALTAACM